MSRLALWALLLATGCGDPPSPSAKSPPDSTDADTDADADADADADTDADADADADTDADADADADEDSPLYSGSWTAPSREDLVGLDLPVDAATGGYVLSTSADVSLVADITRRDPVTAAGACLGLMLACYAPGERNLPGCFANVPTCATRTPWEEAAACCDTSCGARYAALRAEGQPPAAAATMAILAEGSCMPGYDAWEGE